MSTRSEASYVHLDDTFEFVCRVEAYPSARISLAFRECPPAQLCDTPWTFNDTVDATVRQVENVLPRSLPTSETDRFRRPGRGAAVRRQRRDGADAGARRVPAAGGGGAGAGAPIRPVPVPRLQRPRLQRRRQRHQRRRLRPRDAPAVQPRRVVRRRRRPRRRGRRRRPRLQRLALRLYAQDDLALDAAQR